MNKEAFIYNHNKQVSERIYSTLKDIVAECHFAECCGLGAIFGVWRLVLGSCNGRIHVVHHSQLKVCLKIRVRQGCIQVCWGPGPKTDWSPLKHIKEIYVSHALYFVPNWHEFLETTANIQLPNKLILTAKKIE